MKTIAFFTTTRAEFGLLSGLIKIVMESNDLKPLLFVGGAHLLEAYGLTMYEIKETGIPVTGVFEYATSETDPGSLAQSAGRATKELAEIFQKYPFDFVCILGDRFELLSIVQVALIFRRPIIHLHGGEITEGAIDNQIRNMVSKAAHLHFTACEEYSENLKKIGEPSSRIFTTGALGVDNMLNLKKLEKEELFKTLKLKKDKPVVLFTYHPVTLELGISSEDQITNILKALEELEFQVVITSPGIDADREKIISIIKQKVEKFDNYRYIENLGMIKYLSLIPFCSFVIGNSSSGIIEVPFFKIPTVNIGDRQKGRIQHISIINTDYSVESITDGIVKSMDTTFRNSLINRNYKFGDGKAASRMVEIIRNTKIDQSFLRKS